VSVPVKVNAIERKAIFNTLTITGTVVPSASITVTTEAEGNYKLLFNPRTGKTYKMGDIVSKNEKIIALENEEYVVGIRPEVKKLDLENARQEYEKQQSLYDKGGVTLSELKSSEVSYFNAKYDNDDAQLQMKKLSVVAPFDGVIVDLPYFTVGETLSSGTEVMTIMNYRSMVLEADFPEKFMPAIHTGQEAFVTNYNLKEDTLLAVITQLSPAIDEDTRTFKGVLEVENPDLVMRPGMFVKAEVVVEKRDNAIVIDRDLIQKKRNGKVVYVIEGNTAVEKKVNTGIETDNEVEILSGLQSGENLVIEGYEMLSNRTKVKIQK
jgi:RND family efflux transporter MFP subunit